MPIHYPYRVSIVIAVVEYVEQEFANNNQLFFLCSEDFISF